MSLTRSNKFLRGFLCSWAFLSICCGTGFAEENKWFDASWKCRQKITIEDSNPILNQFKIEIPFQDGMRRRMQDIRLCADDGCTPINFFTESVIPEEKTVVWIRLQEDFQKKHVYLYYGNPKGDSASSFDDTFQKLQVSEDTLGLWHFDEGEGVIIRDVSGHGNDLKVEGGEISWSTMDGGQWGDNDKVNFKKGSYVIFPGDGVKTKPYLWLPYSPDLKFSSFTLEVWVRIDRDFSGLEPTIIRKGNGLQYLKIHHDKRGKYPRLFLEGCGMKTFLSPSFGSFASGIAPSLFIGKWHYLAVTLDEITLNLKLYQDAKLIAEKKLDNLPKENTEGFSFGGNYGCTLPGAMDEMRLSSKALTTKEIEANYFRRSLLANGSSKITFEVPETSE